MVQTNQNDLNNMTICATWRNYLTVKSLRLDFVFNFEICSSTDMILNQLSSACNARVKLIAIRPVQLLFNLFSPWSVFNTMNLLIFYLQKRWGNTGLTYETSYLYGFMAVNW